jgi:hypothetical protein
MLLSIVALPALMRFLVPVTAAATGGNAGAVAGAVVGAGTALLVTASWRRGWPGSEGRIRRRRRYR